VREMPDAMPRLLTPFTCGRVTLRNRIVVSPMAQYRAKDGLANDYHLVHLGKYAVGGAALVFVEATAVEARGRTTPFDVGLWRDDQIVPLKRISDFIKSQGSASGIQLAHAGRKGNQPAPWDGPGPAIDPAANGFPIGPSPVAMAPNCTEPREMTLADIADVITAWRDAATRAAAAGFDVLEIHGAHGYLLHQFVSARTNRRNDAYGGSPDRRTRLSLDIVTAIREVWPSDRPLFYRLSATDPSDPEWQLADTIRLAKALKSRGVDIIDCSSGGLERRATTTVGQREQGYLVPFAAAVREQGIPSMAVGLIHSPAFAESIVVKGQADLIAIGRELLVHPNWALQAANQLGTDGGYADWPQQYGWWLSKRAESQRSAA
jgi:2,4-dienoyl-CoA reductase-like NADH-dependent reductase (Old Yellow Enzyme family)